MMRLSLVLFILVGSIPPTVAQTSIDLSPPTGTEFVRGFELRDRYKLPKHIGEAAIFVDSVAVHHIRYEASTIAWKDASGHWQQSQVSESGPGGLLAVQRKLEFSNARSLTIAEGQTLDRLIHDPTLYSEKVQTTGQPEMGAPFHAMAIITPYGRTTVRWGGRLQGKAGEVADIILGHG